MANAFRTVVANDLIPASRMLIASKKNTPFFVDGQEMTIMASASIA